MPVEWLDDPRAFAARDWTPLVEADTDATFFHTPRWLKLYWEEFGAGSLQVARVHQGERDVAAAAFDLRDGTLTWLGGVEVTDYLGPVGLPGEHGPAATELLRALCGRNDWADADLAGLPRDGRWLPALVDAAGTVGLHPVVEDDNVAPFVHLPDSYDAYLDTLPSKRRHEIRRKDRRLRERHPDLRLVDVDPAALPRAMDDFVGLHRSSTGDKGRFMVPGMELFFRRFADELLADGTLRIAFLESAGTRLAGAMGFRWRDRFLLYNSAYDHRFREVSPGMVLVAEMIRAAIEEGRHGFDMLKGDLSYKYRFGARRRRIMRLRLRRRT